MSEKLSKAIHDFHQLEVAAKDPLETNEGKQNSLLFAKPNKIASQDKAGCVFRKGVISAATNRNIKSPLVFLQSTKLYHHHRKIEKKLLRSMQPQIT